MYKIDCIALTLSAKIIANASTLKMNQLKCKVY